MAAGLYQDIRATSILIRSGGDLATGIAIRLFNCGFRVCIVETVTPLAVRRMVSFSEAIYQGKQSVEGVTAVQINHQDQIDSIWKKYQIPVLVDPANQTSHMLRPDVLVDAIMAKRNTGTLMSDAPLVIALGPGFYAGRDSHVVIETNRGHDMGRLIYDGPAAKNTSIPSNIRGFAKERVLRAPCDGIFESNKTIGDRVQTGERIGKINQTFVYSEIDGVIRGLLRSGTQVTRGTKAGDIDPRGDAEYCQKISDKARSLGGAVLEAILSQLPKNSTAK